MDIVVCNIVGYTEDVYFSGVYKEKVIRRRYEGYSQYSVDIYLYLNL